LRLAIEAAAIELAGKHFEDLGYDVTSVERDKKGWDLEARLAREYLRIEVKGRDGKGVSAELTPNEYRQLTKYRDSYRVCIVTDASSKRARLYVFAYSAEHGLWQSDKGQPLVFEKRIGALISSLEKSRSPKTR